MKIDILGEDEWCKRRGQCLYAKFRAQSFVLDAASVNDALV